MLAGTETRPVATFSAGTGSPGLTGTAGVTTDIVTLASAAGAPLSTSPGRTSSTSAAPVRPLTPVTESASAVILPALTVMMTSAVSQLAGFSTSQTV